MKKYLQQNKRTLQRQLGNMTFYGISDLPEAIDIDNVVSRVKKLVPMKLLGDVESVYIGQFPHLTDRDLTAMYADQAIYMTSDQEDEEDMIEDLIHELGHAVEEKYVQQIYSDNKVENEFLAKRKKLYFLLKEQNFEVDIQDFLETRYSEEFDYFLYKEVGYPTLSVISSGLYYSPYAATSLREYFGNGFEAYFYHREPIYLRKISPGLFDKLQEIVYNEE